jgi:hypothetical protein
MMSKNDRQHFRKRPTWVSMSDPKTRKTMKDIDAQQIEQERLRKLGIEQSGSSYKGRSGVTHIFANPLQQQIAEVAAQTDVGPIDYTLIDITERGGQIYLGPFSLAKYSLDIFPRLLNSAIEHSAVDRRIVERKKRHEQMISDDSPAVPAPADSLIEGDPFLEELKNAISLC